MVGKPGAPLDTFLDMVCPAIGLVSAEEYFDTFNWIWEEAPEGSATLRQTAEPDFRRFDHNILHTTMTEVDVIKFCGVMGYLPMTLATQMSTGLISGHPQQGLLASAPRLPPQPFQAEKDVTTFLTPLEQTYGWNFSHNWTGSLSDLYNPSEAIHDLADLFHGPESDLWKTSNVQDPQSLESYLDNDGMGYAYLNPLSRFLPNSWERI